MVVSILENGAIISRSFSLIFQSRSAIKASSGSVYMSGESFHVHEIILIYRIRKKMCLKVYNSESYSLQARCLKDLPSDLSKLLNSYKNFILGSSTIYDFREIASGACTPGGGHVWGINVPLQDSTYEAEKKKKKK